MSPHLKHLMMHRGCIRGAPLSFLLCCAGLFTAPQALPAESGGSDYISILPGFVRPTDLTGASRHGFNLEGMYGHPFNPRWSLEFNLNASIFEVGRDRGNDFYQRAFEVDGVFNLMPRRGTGFTAFLVAGAGVLNDDLYPDARDGYAGVLSAGLGMVSAPLFRNGLMFRAEVRYVHDTKEGGISEPRISVGIEIPLGRVERVVEYKEVKTVEVREVIREVPRTVEAAIPDADGDGVDDAHDKCPGTPHGVRVDSDGCAVADQVVALDDVNFETNKATLTDTATARLDALAAAFHGQPGLAVEIAGHTDTVGSSAYNMSLSQRRAQAVRTYLIARGIAPARLTARGYGFTRLLVVPESTEADRARNRRVEMHIVRSR